MPADPFSKLRDAPTKSHADFGDAFGVTLRDTHAPFATELIDSGDSVSDTTPTRSVVQLPALSETIGAGKRLYQYEVLRELGRGGMGTVYLARDTKLARRVALKLLTADNVNSCQRFMAEARATARCRHDNIVVIYDINEHEGMPFMVLEYLQGQSLRELLDRGPISPERAVEIMIPVVRALQCAHEQGIIHRDLKPANIFLTDAGAIKVLDFGIAKFLEPSLPLATEEAASPESSADDMALTRVGARVGSLPYMAPEQLRGDAVDARADIWAAGMVLYELVNGQHPLTPLSKRKLLRMALYAEPIPSALHHARVAMPPRLAALIDRCLDLKPSARPQSAHELAQALDALVPAYRPTTQQSEGSPFTGLAAFQEGEADRFFGRSRDIAALVTRLRSQPLIALAGPCGIGKSSLVRAGLIPALKRSGETWDTYILRPGRHPLAALASMLESWRSALHPSTPSGERSLHSGEVSIPELLGRLRAEPGYLGVALRAWASQTRSRLLLFVDQLEELYTLGASAEERTAFIACLAGVADDPSSPLRLVVSMRSDFLDRLAEERQLMSQTALVFVPPVDREGLREALVRPVEVMGFTFESQDLIDRMLDALEATQVALPLLQCTAAQLWERRDRGRRMLTEASYEAIGGVIGALSAHADTVLGSMAMREQTLARTAFEHLVTPERTRAVRSMEELGELVRAPEAMKEVIQYLASMRLLALSTDEDSGDTTVELIHESLILEWATLKRWLDERKEDVAFVARLHQAAAQWEKSGRDEGLLWRGEPAREADAWYSRRRPLAPGQGGSELTSRDEEYLRAVIALAARSRFARRAVVGSVIAILAIVAASMSYLAWQRDRANEAALRAAGAAQVEAVHARNATRIAAVRAISADPTLQLAILREIEDETPPGWHEQARRAMSGTIAHAMLVGHSARAVSVGFSPDGKRVVSASDDQTVRVWNADGSGEQLVLRGHEKPVKSVAFSPDGKRIVSGSADQTVRVWNADGTGEPLVLRGHARGVMSVAFSPDGRRIISGSADQTVRVWNADGTGEPLVLTGHAGGVWSAAFSADGKQIVSASEDRTVRVWSANGMGEPLVLTGHAGDVWSAAFSPDGRRIVSGSWDQTVRVWNADGAGEPLVLTGHTDMVRSVLFSPDGRRIVSASWDRTVRVWNADGAGEPLVLITGHAFMAWWAALSPDGTRVATVGEDKMVRIWHLEDAGGELSMIRAHQGWTFAAEFSPDGAAIASASADKTVRLFLPDGSERVFRGHADYCLWVTFRPDGAQILSTAGDGTARVWNVDGAGEPLVLKAEGMLSSAMFSPDQTRIVVSGSDGNVRIWNADGAGEPLVLRGHSAWVRAVVFSPDGRQVASASDDGTMRLWNADGSGQPRVFAGDMMPVWSVAFSPDGKELVSAYDDGTIRIWPLSGSGAPRILRGHPSRVYSVAFSPDGAHVVSSGADGTVRLWNADGSGEAVIVGVHDRDALRAVFSPDGKRIVSTGQDNTVRIWSDFAPLTPEDPRLWQATTYCMPVSTRKELLGISDELAQDGYRECLERVARTRAVAGN